MLTILIAEKDFNSRAKNILAKGGRVIDFVSNKTFFSNLASADVLVTGLEVKLSKDVLDKAVNLKLVGSRTTQLRYIDLDECRGRGIKIINIRADSPVLKKTYSTAEETIALMLALLRNIPAAFDSIKKSEWDRKKYAGVELYNKTIGLIGFGRLGRMVSKYSIAFGMKVLAHDPFISHKEMKEYGVRKAGLADVLKKSDIVSLHLVYNDSTFGMIKEKHFKMMKPSAIFINTARGEITDEAALFNALNDGSIAGAALDTLSNEMPDGSHIRSNPLVEYAKNNSNLIIVPHLGGSTKEANERTQVYISELVLKEIKKWKTK